MATLETGHFRLPPQLDVNSGNISENFKRWKRQVEVYLAASGTTAKDKKVQTAIILNCAGPEVLEVYDNFTWESEGDEEKPDKVLEALERYWPSKMMLRRSLDRLVEKGVLVPVTEPTEWVSQMAVVHKRDGKLRICIDPQPLNAALNREHYRLPVLDDVLPKLKDSKVFSKLDVREAYWHVRLDDSSSRLTTMITPFGRYMWKRLPFGLKVSSEIFQRKIDEIPDAQLEEIRHATALDSTM